jgi:hypothetical protein
MDGLAVPVSRAVPARVAALSAEVALAGADARVQAQLGHAIPTAMRGAVSPNRASTTSTLQRGMILAECGGQVGRGLRAVVPPTAGDC